MPSASSRRSPTAIELGVTILGVSLTDARPPTEVEADFAAAQSAESERDRRINEAKSYHETTIVAARSAAGAKLEAARAAATRKLVTARAEAERFAVLAAEVERSRCAHDPPAVHRIDAVAACSRQNQAHRSARRRPRPDRARTQSRDPARGGRYPSQQTRPDRRGSRCQAETPEHPARIIATTQVSRSGTDVPDERSTLLGHSIPHNFTSRTEFSEEPGRCEHSLTPRLRKHSGRIDRNFLIVWVIFVDWDE